MRLNSSSNSSSADRALAMQFRLPTVWKNSLRMVLAGIGLLAVLSMSACASSPKSAGGCADSCAMKEAKANAADCSSGQCPMKKAAADAKASSADCPCQKAKAQQPAG